MSELPLDKQNTAFMQAVAFVNQTNQNLFLTGKAGTGKTTFLRYINKHSYKKMAITAPTGVAAMNAGGTTLHALFWLPFGVFLEDYEMNWSAEDNNIYNKSRLFSTIKLTKQRRAILQELELLVIDEVSMVRSDTLDAIDVILKSVRRDQRPFGGVQVLFIGDLYQLPPVVRDFEWSVLRGTYSSPFFFDAKVMREYPPVMLELNHIYRQKDDSFINLLNNIRNNQVSKDDLEQLNVHYKADFEPASSDQYITLTSHNRLADTINQEELVRLPGKMLNIKAVIKDEFQQGSYPTDETLTLKIGAQVMFIKNDTGDDRKYFNGKIGTVKEINLDKQYVVVSFPDGSDDVMVKREIWENIRYNYDKGQDEINSEVLGTFSQYPLRLAWAITIHKSQGLTFERAIIDAGTSFAAGQVYVALSRLTGLEGLILKSPIPAHSIRTDFQVVSFMQRMLPEGELPAVLEQCQKNYLGQILLNSFRWTALIDETVALQMSLADRNIDDKAGAEHYFVQLVADLRKQEKVAHSFINQLYTLLSDKSSLDYTRICERTKSAVQWFQSKIDDELIKPTFAHINAWKIKKRTKKYIDELSSLHLDYKRKLDQLLHCLTIAETLMSDGNIGEAVTQMEKFEKSKDDQVKTATEDTETKDLTKLDTKQITLEMYQDGHSIEEIAQKRGMVAGTIYGHLINFIGDGVEAHELIEQDKLDLIIEVIRKHPDASASELKSILGPSVDYPDIRIGQKVLSVD
ncbi:helix-turn-helix domain-containing protein [Sphingobacterium spiritivorum]|uniref:helix-turn-helix domain-containing protein n=1 Tax=Sphingobacterium TaxID=28453 RepID=UPI0025D07A04|nr:MULTISPECIES: helix-turn-helix domain-containing protein [unclassified Sphingobacterium]